MKVSIRSFGTGEIALHSGTAYNNADTERDTRNKKISRGDLQAGAVDNGDTFSCLRIQVKTRFGNKSIEKVYKSIEKVYSEWCEGVKIDMPTTDGVSINQKHVSVNKLILRPDKDQYPRIS
jgi:hypothetical protein